MSTLQDKIAQFQKMAAEDPDNELGHFRLGQFLAEDNQFAEAEKCFRRVIELSPEFSKAHQLLGESLVKQDKKPEAIEALTTGWKVADGRGDRMPRDAMAKMLTDLGAPIPVSTPVAAKEDDGPDTGFRCSRPGCTEGRRAVKMTKPPIPDEIGVRIAESVCAVCWESWRKDYSVKVVNELRLDLSSESGAEEYDKYMRGYFGFDESPAHL